MKSDWTWCFLKMFWKLISESTSWNGNSNGFCSKYCEIRSELTELDFSLAVVLVAFLRTWIDVSLNEFQNFMLIGIGLLIYVISNIKYLDTMNSRQNRIYPTEKRWTLLQRSIDNLSKFNIFQSHLSNVMLDFWKVRLFVSENALNSHFRKVKNLT